MPSADYILGFAKLEENPNGERAEVDPQKA
jgi:hypothetical protein